MAKYAIVRDGVVLNVTEWDGETPWSPPEGTEAVLDAEETAERGGTWDGSAFTRAPIVPPAPQPKSFEELVAEATSFDELKRLVIANNK